MTRPQISAPVVAAAPLVAPTLSVGLTDHAEALQAILGHLGTVTVSQLVQLFRQYQHAPDFPAVLKAAFPEVITPHADAAAQITAQWFNDVVPDAQATPVVDVPVERIAKTVDWALYAPSETKPAGEINPQTTLDRLAGSGKRMVMDASRNTVIENTKTTKIRWARYASATACAFCRVLATRGPVYWNKEAALKAHDHCRCIAVPVPKGETYTQPSYVAEWEKAYEAAREAGNSSLSDILAHMRGNTNAR